MQGIKRNIAPTHLRFILAYVLIACAVWRWKIRTVTLGNRVFPASAFVGVLLVLICHLGATNPGPAASLWQKVLDITHTWRYSLMHTVAHGVQRVNDVNAHVTSSAAAKVKHLSHYAKSHVKSVQDSVKTLLEGKIDVLTHAAVARVAQTITDPDMPVPLKQFIHETLQRVTPQVRREIMRRANRFLGSPPAVGRSTLTSPPLRALDLASPAVSAPTPGPILRMQDVSFTKADWSLEKVWEVSVAMHRQIRAFVLYNLVPSDKSMWANMKNPYYWLLTSIGMIPFSLISNAWWWLIFWWKDTSDEHQLVDFVVGFETSKFFSDGCWGLLQGSFRYFLCTTFPKQLSCATIAPQMHLFDALVFVFQLLLVIWAFEELWHLPHHRNRRLRSESSPTRTASTDSFSTGQQGVHSVPPSSPPPVSNGVWNFLQAAQRKGGALQLLYRYKLTVISWTIPLLMTLFVYNYLFTTDTQNVVQLAPSVAYWIRTWYGLLALPFVFFKLPLAMRLYVTDKFTGYNRLGELVRTNTAPT